MGLSWRMKCGPNKVLLMCGVCPYVKSRLKRAAMLSRRSMSRLVETALDKYLPQ